MQIGIIQFPGSNCERETALAVKRAGMTPVFCLWNETPEKLSTLDGYIIVGGFSYEDRSRAGIIAACHPIMHIVREQSELGKPVLGICNGAQILVETGLVPGYKDYPLQVALTDNRRIKEGQVYGTGFYNTWSYMKASNASVNSAFTRLLKKDEPIHLPIAHAEGRFVMPIDVLNSIKEHNLIALQYCDKDGLISDEFPVNPNGSMANIAAITNVQGNVMAMMPHPERTTNGDVFFHAMREYIAEGCRPFSPELEGVAVQQDIKPCQFLADSHQMIVELIITDNQAFTVENSVRKLGLPVSLKRQILWEVQCESKSTLHQIQASGVLYNPQKEFIASVPEGVKQKSLLIRAKEDWVGQQKMQQLSHHFGIDGVTGIRQGILWHIQAPESELDHAVAKILDNHLLYNPISHECSDYE